MGSTVFLLPDDVRLALYGFIKFALTLSDAINRCEAREGNSKAPLMLLILVSGPFRHLDSLNWTVFTLQTVPHSALHSSRALQYFHCSFCHQSVDSCCASSLWGTLHTIRKTHNIWKSTAQILLYTSNVNCTQNTAQLRQSTINAQHVLHTAKRKTFLEQCKLHKCYYTLQTYSVCLKCKTCYAHCTLYSIV